MASVVIDIPSKWNNPGDFTRIRISTPGQKEFVLTNENGWIKYVSDEASLSSELKKTNLIRSVNALGLKAKESGRIRVILHRDEFGFKELRDLDGDGSRR